MSHDWAAELLQAVAPRGALRLGDAAARVPHAPDKAALLAATAQLQERLAELQEALHADGRHALLLVLQGRDASGKDGTIKKVMGALNPVGVRVTAFGPALTLPYSPAFRATLRACLGQRPQPSWGATIEALASLPRRRIDER